MDIDQENQDLQNLFHSPTPEPQLITENNNTQNDAELAQTLEDEDEDDGAGLFGDDDEDDDDAMQQDGNDYNNQYSDNLTEEERRSRQRLEYNEDDNQGEIQKREETIAQVSLANLGIPKSDRTWHARLPNFLNLETTPFDENVWEPKEDEFDESQEGGTSTPGGSQKAAVLDENVIRWRWGTDQMGNDIKETNSRIVRWSDGSLSLQIGSELFDISSQVEPTTSASSTKSTHNSTSLSTFDSTRSHGLTYLTAAHDYANLIEAQASIHGTMTFRPSTTASNTHKKLAKSIAKRNVKSRAIKLDMTPAEDPEKKKLDQEKAEVERIKQAKKEKAKKMNNGGGGKRTRKETRFVDGSDDDEDMEDRGDDDDEDDDGFDNAATTGSRSNAKRGRGGPLDQGGDDDEEEEDDDGFVVAEGEDGEGNEEAEGSEDEIDERDQKIERDERRRKERKKEKKAVEEDDRPAEPAQGVRRRLVVDDDEDE